MHTVKTNEGMSLEEKKGVSYYIHQLIFPPFPLLSLHSVQGKAHQFCVRFWEAHEELSNEQVFLILHR